MKERSGKVVAVPVIGQRSSVQGALRLCASVVIESSMRWAQIATQPRSSPSRQADSVVAKCFFNAMRFVNIRAKVYRTRLRLPNEPGVFNYARALTQPGRLT